ncbi:MAG: osmotically inducible protein C, partial [Bacteroidota bacterium]
MKSSKVHFPNGRGQTLSARMEMPANRHPHAYAIFAHCFTCGKDIAAAARIARGLTARGYGVLRFDFTGLGHSEGEFA